MNIKVKIRLIIVNPASALRAVASVILDDAFIIHNVRLVQRNGNMFVSMPSVIKGGGWKNVCHPIKAELRKEMEAACVAAYENNLSERGLALAGSGESKADA
ncbi:MAG: SpoVG family protein [Clostridiales bacterium]|nr:SpoVG family protein [Clostridiales bacterium]